MRRMRDFFSSTSWIAEFLASQNNREPSAPPGPNIDQSAVEVIELDEDEAVDEVPDFTLDFGRQPTAAVKTAGLTEGGAFGT